MVRTASTTRSFAPRDLIRPTSLGSLSVRSSLPSHVGGADTLGAVGRGGKNVQDEWAEIPTHYLSMAIGPEFPNWFIVNGPNSSLGSGSLLVLFEREVDYIVEVRFSSLSFRGECALIPLVRAGNRQDAEGEHKDDGSEARVRQRLYGLRRRASSPSPTSLPR